MWRPDTASTIGPSAPGPLPCGAKAPALQPWAVLTKESEDAGLIRITAPSIVTAAGGRPGESVKPSTPLLVTWIWLAALRRASIDASVPGVTPSILTQYAEL